MRKYRGQAFAQSTTATYKSQLRAYLCFCLYFGYTPVPCSSHHLLRYVVFPARTLSASSISCYLNVVRILHPQSGFPNPLQEPLFKFQKDLLMRGIKRLHGNAVRQKLPITPDLLRKLHGTLDFTNSLDATFWAACVIAFSPSFGSPIYSSRRRAHSTLENTYACAIFASVSGASCSLCAGLRLFSIAIAPCWCPSQG